MRWAPWLLIANEIRGALVVALILARLHFHL
jgi:hypothetical protein